MKKIIIADDHHFIMEGLSAFLEPQGFTAIGKACNVDEVKQLSEDHVPDIWLLDCDMPGGTAVELLAYLKQHVDDPQVIYFTGKYRGEEFRQLIALGIRGLVSKTESKTDLVQALNNNKLEPYISPRLKELLPTQQEQLTPKELEALFYFIDGVSNTEVAELMNISIGTAKVHRKNIMKKLHVHNIVDLVKLVEKKGWL